MLQKHFKQLILVIGAGPSIEESRVQNYLLEICNSGRGKFNTAVSGNMVVIAADGATEMCLDLGDKSGFCCNGS